MHVSLYEGSLNVAGQGQGVFGAGDEDAVQVEVSGERWAPQHQLDQRVVQPTRRVHLRSAERLGGAIIAAEDKCEFGAEAESE